MWRLVASPGEAHARLAVRRIINPDAAQPGTNWARRTVVSVRCAGAGTFGRAWAVMWRFGEAQARQRVGRCGFRGGVRLRGRQECVGRI